MLVVGDSLSVGEHASDLDRGYTACLTRALRGRPSDAPTAGIEAISGARLREFVERPLPPARRLVVVEIGTNDWLGYVPRGLWRPTPPEQFGADYARLLDRVMAGGAALVCLGIWGPADARAEADGAAAGAGLAAYDDAISAACRTWGGAFAALSAVYDRPGTRGPTGRRTPWGISDATHPNDEGHRMIADLVVAAYRCL